MTAAALGGVPVAKITVDGIDPLLSRENQAATADVEVTLDITPCVPLVFQALGSRSESEGEWTMRVGDVPPRSVQVPVCNVSELP